MNVREFETNRDEAMNKIEITTDYIPYIQKVSECKNIVDIVYHKKITDDKTIFVNNATTGNLFYIMKLVQLYTNIAFEDTDMVEAYDILQKNLVLDLLFGNDDGVTPLINWRELKEFKNIMNMVMDDLYQNEYSVPAILSQIKDAVGMVIGSMIDDTIQMVETTEQNEQ